MVCSLTVTMSRVQEAISPVKIRGSPYRSKVLLELATVPCHLGS